MKFTITVDTADKPVLTVPVQAVMGASDLGGAREVYVKTDAGGYDRRPVKLGIYNEKVVEILAKYYGKPKRNITIVSGSKSKHKIVEVV